MEEVSFTDLKPRNMFELFLKKNSRINQDQQLILNRPANRKTASIEKKITACLPIGKSKGLKN